MYYNITYVHGRTYKNDMASALVTMPNHLRKNDESVLNGVNIDTGANRRSVISQGQYRAYRREIGVKIPMRLSKKKVLKGIGGLSAWRWAL